MEATGKGGGGEQSCGAMEGADRRVSSSPVESAAPGFTWACFLKTRLKCCHCSTMPFECPPLF